MFGFGMSLQENRNKFGAFFAFFVTRERIEPD